MDLREYLFKNRITATELANKLGYNATYINMIKNKDHKPSKRLAKAIEDATNGEVTVEELLK